LKHYDFIFSSSWKPSEVDSYISSSLIKT
jgi:hypothetical protein